MCCSDFSFAHLVLFLLSHNLILMGNMNKTNPSGISNEYSFYETIDFHKVSLIASIPSAELNK